MLTYTLDSIVRQVLVERGYPMHFYLQFLAYGVSCLRELNFDVLKSFKSVRLPVNSYKAVTLPCDLIDVVRLGDELGQYVQPWSQDQSFNRLNNFNSSGEKIPYDDAIIQEVLVPYYGGNIFFNSYGEFLGRVYNNQPYYENSFLLIRERNEIQLDVNYSGETITLDYITDGLTLDASNAIHPYATETLKAYIVWKMKENARQYGVQERRDAKDEFYNQLRILKGRLNPVDINDIRRSLSKAYGPTIKN